MPLYEYRCSKCHGLVEIFRMMHERNMPLSCVCGAPLERLYSVPAVSIWDPSRSFPNAVRTGPGTFPTRAAYEAHLNANDMAETRTDGKIRTPHGSKVIRSVR